MSQFSPPTAVDVYPLPTQGGDDYPPPSVRLPDHKNPYDLNHNIMLTAIISFSIVILLVIALHIYARCVLQRQARRRAAIHQLGFAVAHAHSGEPPRAGQGLEPAVIAMLPMFVFKRVDSSTGDDGNNTITECAVCLCTLEDEEMARLLPNCKHTFHAECVDKWFGSHSTCPICRTEAQPPPQPEPREGPVEGLSTAPPLERIGSMSLCLEGTSDCAAQPSPKIGGSSSRLNSFRRILSRERSSRRVHSCGQEDGIIDLERQ